MTHNWSKNASYQPSASLSLSFTLILILGGVAHLIYFHLSVKISLCGRTNSQSALIFLPGLLQRFFARELRTHSPFPHALGPHPSWSSLHPLSAWISWPNKVAFLSGANSLKPCCMCGNITHLSFVTQWERRPLFCYPLASALSFLCKNEDVRIKLENMCTPKINILNMQFSHYAQKEKQV